MSKVIVTGGSGLVGNGIKDSLSEEDLETYNWNFLSSKDCDLRNRDETMEYFRKERPNFVIHCAANVGGLFKNMKNNLKMFQDNLEMNRNVLAACADIKVEKLVSVLTTCIFPDKIESYPFNENDLHKGPPHPSNEGYAYAKRLLEVRKRFLTFNIV